MLDTPRRSESADRREKDGGPRSTERGLRGDEIEGAREGGEGRVHPELRRFQGKFHKG